MTELNLAAQAVNNAFWKAGMNKWNIYDKRRAQLAAAFHTAANLLTFVDDYGTQLINADELIAIAAELESIDSNSC